MDEGINQVEFKQPLRLASKKLKKEGHNIAFRE
jgi:hypothetical protein